MQFPRRTASRQSKERCAFTLTELLIVIVIVAVVGSLLLLAISRSKWISQSKYCASNLRQLITATQLYAADNRDHLPPNEPIDRGKATACWVSGYMDFDPDNSDNTNSVLLTDPRYSILAPYAASALLYRCPGDPSVVPGLGPRVRSIAMNQAVGTRAKGEAVWGSWLSGQPDGKQTNWLTYPTLSSITSRSPSMLWMLVDEQPDSINDAGFAVQCAYTNGDNAVIIDFPGCFHNGGTGIAFADGHSETRRWIGQTIQPQPTFKSVLHHKPARDSMVDLNWLQVRTSAAK